MPSATDKTILAGFRGIPFYVETETEEGGRKVAVHEYPGSDNRFVQDLGLDPGVFRVRGYVADFKSNGAVQVGWEQLDRKLTNAFKNQDEGLLDMSTFGLVRVKAQSYTKTQNQKTLGRVDYNMTFLVSTPNPSPIFAPSSELTVASKASDVLDSVESDVSEFLKVPTVATEALVSTYDGGQIAGTVADKITAVGGDFDSVTKFANSIRNNIADLVRDPIAYAEAMFNDGLLGSVFNTVAATRDTVNALSSLCRVGYNLANDFETIKDDALSNAAQSFNIPEFADDTNYRITNNDNRLVISNGVRIGLFAIYMKDAVKVEYNTDSEINIVISDINDIYQNTTTIEGVTPETALAVDVCRIDALKVLDAKLLTTPNVESFDLNVPTADVELAYRLYAEDMNTVDSLELTAEVLTNLNDILPSRYKDTVEVLRL